jgi:stage II sporulation protein D
VFEIDGRPYRGAVELRVMPAGIAVINEVGIEDYLRGVVGAEISSLSPLETLRAQAVIARTYAVANRGKHGKDGFDLCAREHCQAYGGVKAERPVIDGAVRDTRGIIMISDGVPISTLYHATCGGMTSDNEKVFGGSPTSYLRRVKCPFCKAGTNYRWRREIRASAILARLREEGYAASRLWRVQLDSPAPLDRVDRLTFFTDRGPIPIKGTTFRRWFDLPSTTFQLARATPTARPAPARQPLAAATPARSHASHAAPSKLSPPSGSHPQPGTELRSPSQGYALPRPRLTTLPEPTPTALVVQSGAGLVRARRPPGGWMVLALAAAAPEQPATDAASRSGPLASPATPSRGEPLPPPLDASGTQDLVLDRESGDPIIPLLGRGYGHQVGLCQAGAVELGRRQWSYRQILAFYYSNVALRRLQY